jgi:hypothetical protein
VLPLPELVAGRGRPDVEVRLGRVARVPSENGHYASEGEVSLSWKGVGSFLVRGGSEIVVDAPLHVEWPRLRLFTLGPALGVLLRQRGRLVLHASALSVDGAAIAFLGGSGWGRSTIAAALQARGHGIAADDIVAVDVRGDQDTPLVYPGFPQVKLWPDAAAALLGRSPDALPRIHSRSAKRAHCTIENFPDSPLPLQAIYVLAGGGRQAIEDLPPQEALVELLRHSYGARLLHGIRTSAHFRDCVKVAAGVAVRRLETQRSLEALPDLVRLVESDLAGCPARAP